MAVFSLGDGDEVRLVFLGYNPDGTVYVRQVSEGVTTSLCYGSDRHTEVLTFKPTKEFSLADVADDIERRGEEFYIDDLSDTLRLWDVPYERRSIDDARFPHRGDTLTDGKSE